MIVGAKEHLAHRVKKYALWKWSKKWYSMAQYFRNIPVTVVLNFDRQNILIVFRLN